MVSDRWENGCEDTSESGIESTTREAHLCTQHIAIREQERRDQSPMLFWFTEARDQERADGLPACGRCACGLVKW
jgi:hypothetical protein